MVTVAAGKGLYLPLQFHNPANTCWGKVPKFQEKTSHRSRDIYPKPPRRVTPRPFVKVFAWFRANQWTVND